MGKREGRREGEKERGRRGRKGEEGKEGRPAGRQADIVKLSAFRILCIQLET